MPVIEVRIWDIERLVGEPLTYRDIESSLELLKAEVEGVKGDTLMFEASHDRPDLFSAEGIGRAIRYLRRLTVESSSRYREIGYSDSVYLELTRTPGYRPYAYAMVVRGVELDDEALKQLFQLQEKLHLTYCGDRRLVSIGLYDLEKVSPPLRYTAVSNVCFTPLDEEREMDLPEILRATEKGVMYAHLVKKGEYPLLVDSKGTVLSFPPIINSEETRVTEETKNVVIDVTGIEPRLMAKALVLIATSVAERGKNPRIELVRIVGEEPNEPEYIIRGRYISLDGRVLEKVVGFKPLNHELKDTLLRMGYERLSELLRDVMIGLGFNEVINFMLVDKEILARTSTSVFVELENPKLRTYSALRNSLIPSMLLTASINVNSFGRFKVFEIGDYVVVRNGKPLNSRSLAFCILDSEVTLTDGLVAIKSILRTLGIEYRLREAKLRPFIDGRAAEVVIPSGEVIGVIGEVQPEILVSLGINKPVIIGEIYVNKLLNVV
ncbi:MAG: hypothetical protein B6U73_03630 [Desulfurococcales archaeon ex4484_204]|nr:MAG: hypothetical protein B6U73_03630 [Desulfurococcales archaeon ex4484_204]